MTAWFRRNTKLFAYLGVCLTAAFGFYEHEQRINNDARAERRAAYNTCVAGNERIEAIRNVLISVLRDPTEAEFAWIEDDNLRAGALNNAKEARARIRIELQTKLQSRDCDLDIPKPPPEE